MSRVGTTSRVDARLEQARARLQRVAPVDVAGRLDLGAVLVDIRPLQQRAVEGEVRDALVVDRNVLEWRFDPTNEAALPWASRNLEVIVLCQEGYASSFAAESLLDLGVTRATDVAGGFAAWKAAGLPWTTTVSPTLDQLQEVRDGGA